MAPKNIQDYVLLMLGEIEREGEMKILNDILEQLVLFGMNQVLDALQLGCVEMLILPCAFDYAIYKCQEYGYVATTETLVKEFCENPEQVPLRQAIWDLTQLFRAHLGFLRRESEKWFMGEFQGITAYLR